MKTGDIQPTALFFFVIIALALQGIVWWCSNIRTAFFCFWEIAIRLLTEIALILNMALVIWTFLTILSPHISQLGESRDEATAEAHGWAFWWIL